MKGLTILCAASVLILAAGSAHADMTVIDFDSLDSGTYVDEQFSGADFNNNAIILGSLTPPYIPNSGDKVIWNFWNDPGYDIRIDADGPKWLMAGGYVTGSENVTLTAYDSQGSVGTDSTGGDNRNNPNMFLSISAANIEYVIFKLDSLESYHIFTVDDLTFNPVPGPAAVLLGMLGLSIAGIKLRKFV